MSSYVTAPATILLATHCCCCGLPLVDAISVELGIGPECRKGENQGIDEQQRKLCNQLTHQAALAAQRGNVDAIRQCADAIRNLGLDTLADKVARRFVNAERLAKIIITNASNDCLRVVTPYKRSQSEAFVDAWRAIPGRRYEFSTKTNIVPAAQRKALWTLLKAFFPGEFGTSPTGTFRVPGEKKKKTKAA
jgi:hypothetical protein